MNRLQNLFNGQPNANMMNNNIFMQFMSMNEEQRAEKIADLLNQRGITKQQLENLIKNARGKNRL